MDENDIQSFGNTPTRDSEKYFENLSSEYDGCKIKKHDELHKTISNDSRDLQNDKLLDTNSSLSKRDTITDVNKKAEYENLRYCHGRESNNEKDKNQVFLSNAEHKSISNNVAKNVKMNPVLSKQIASIEELEGSHSLDQILTTEDYGISVVNKEEVFTQEHGSMATHCLIHTVSPESITKIPSDKIDVVEMEPENINVGENYVIKPNLEVPDVPLPKLSGENDEEQIVFYCDNQFYQTSLQSSSNCDGNFTKVKTNKDEEDELVKVEEPNLNSFNPLIHSKSVAELSSTACISKPNSLVEDAKLVKLSASTKSVNIMQSNAQFLNKSRNFLNFITEKSTNIMEKTLLPQNLAAKYNSILRLTDNNPASYRKFIEEIGSNSDSVRSNSTVKPDSDLGQNYKKSDEIAYNLTKVNIQDSDNTNVYNKEQQNESVLGNCSVQENSTKVDENLFLKCPIIENKFNGESTLRQQENETTSSNVLPDMTSEHNQQNSNHEAPSIIKKAKINNLIVASTKGNRNVDNGSIMSKPNSLDKISTVMLEGNSEHLCKNKNTGNVVINTKDSTEVNAIDDDAVSSYREENNAAISPGIRPVSIENSDQEQIIDENDSARNLKAELIAPELLAHPGYIALLRDYRNLKEQNGKLLEANVKLEMENQRMAAENNSELHALQLETLEKTIEQLRHDLKQATASQEHLNKEYLLANKERESMVMKYVIGEKQLIDTQRAREYAERKVHEALKEQELLHTKLKQVQGERTRICNILDGKCHELTDVQKEVDRLKEELSMREIKLKWTQNKLKTESEAHKESQQKLDKAMLRINEMKEECEQVRRESFETIRKFQQSEENKVVTLDHQLKEQQARLILERHVTEDKELSRLQLQKEVETLKHRQHALIEENNTLSLKVQNLEKERLNYETNLSNLKVIADQRQKEIVDLVGKVSQLETLKLQLQHKEQLLSSNETEVERLRQSNTELQSDMEWCREREAHMLEFTQKLTDKNVRLQSEFTAMEAKNEQLELEQGPLHEQIKELSSKVKALEISLESEKSKRTEECELLARHVAEQTQLARNLAQKLEDSQGENAVLRRKQQISVKEMTKELQQCKRRLDAFETGSPSNSLDRTSRTGSSSSLSTGETLNGTVSDNSNSGDHILQSVEPDRQTLIDRIVKLQRIRVRQAEKLDFLEEHTRTLVNELQKKTKIIKNYILHEIPDAMGSNERDRNKAELARHSGIMASVYNQRVSDNNMTLELSLEMNQKLQAVLEDTLLKNITLKDSIDTLGEEIARLTIQNKRMQ